MTSETRTTTKSRYKTLIPPKKNIFPIFVWLSILLNLSGLGLMLISTVGVWRLNLRPPPSLIQLNTGETIKVVGAASNYRRPEVVRNFVSDIAVLLFNWSSTVKIKQSDGGVKTESDIGVVVDPNAEKFRVPTPAWEASFALSESFRTEFLKGIAQLVPDSVWEGKTNTFLKVRYVSSPQQIESGKWKVTLLSDLLIFEPGKAAGYSVPVNKEFIVIAVDTPEVPSEILSNPIQEMVYQRRLAALEVVAIKDYQQ